MQSVVYTYGGALYINLTNRCPCRCVFCIRSGQEGVGSAGSLWLEHDPSAAEVIAALREHDLSAYDEIIFCGYGEPMYALDTLLEVCRFLRSEGGHKIRLNTNGLGDLINGQPTAPLLRGLVDAVSISLNAPSPERYDELCSPSFGPGSYDALLAFAGACRELLPETVLSVVDVISPEEIAACREIAAALGVPLRVRHFSE